jgi:hypothetical protein
MAESSDEDAPQGALGSADGVDVGAAAEPRPKRQRGRPRVVCVDEGPHVYVAIVGTNSIGCQWRNPAPPTMQFFNAKLRSLGLGSAEDVSYRALEDQILGIGVASQWRFVRGGAPVTPDTSHLMIACQQHRDSRTTMGFLEVPFHCVGRLGTPVSIPFEDRFANGLHNSRLHDLICSLRDEDATIEAPALSGTFVPARVWLRRAELRFGVVLKVDTLFPMVSWHPSAALFAYGALSADVVPVLRRDRMRVRLGRGPSKRQENLYLESIGVSNVSDNALLAPAISCDDLVVGKHNRRKGRFAFDIKHLIGAIRTSQDLISSQRLPRVVENSLRYAMPQSADHVLKQLHLDGFENPSRWTMERNQVRLDVTCMLLARQDYKTRGPFFRCVTYDSTPKNGLEVFNCVEDVIPRSAVWDKTLEEVDMSLMETRLLPCLTFAQGCVAAVDKSMGFVHQTWLLYGATKGHLYAANEDVVISQADRGVEKFIAKQTNLVEHYYRGHSADLVVPTEYEPMYPNALDVPGPMHQLDWCLVRALERLNGWVEWVRLARQCIAFLRVKGYRLSMRRALDAILSKHTVDAATSLDIRVARLTLTDFSASLADWRWHTAYDVSSQLAVVSQAIALLHRFYPHDLGKMLATHNSVLWQGAYEAFVSNSFWYHAHPICIC